MSRIKIFDNKEKKINAWVITTFLVLLVLFAAISIYNHYSRDGGEVSTPQVGTYCDEESRQEGVCLALYQPVCGWFNASKIQCIKYPCAQTFSNNCFACKDQNVDSWTDGECPK